MDLELTYKEARELESVGEYGLAAALYRGLVRESEDPRFHIAFGVCLQHLNHWEESISHFERGLELKPHYCEGDARLMLAKSLLKVGRKKLAIEQWEVVAAMEPEYPSYEAVPNEAKQMLAQYAA